ncbi:MAG: hypothetical protein LBB36_07075, partial [Fibromonadaceae bacterium]|nr:hypothetical protein [Fibromonadaceae bacterium]
SIYIRKDSEAAISLAISIKYKIPLWVAPSAVRNSEISPKTAFLQTENPDSCGLNAIPPTPKTKLLQMDEGYF